MEARAYGYKRWAMPWARERHKLAFTVDGVLSPDECAQLVDRATAAGWHPSPMAPLQLGDRARLDDDDLAALIFDRLRPFLPPVHRRCALEALTPTFRFVRYAVGAEVQPHPDTAGGDRHTPVKAPRASMFTCLLYLNEGYVGCETHLLPSPGSLPAAESLWPDVCRKHGVAVEHKLGRALVFEHDVLHGCPPLEDTGDAKCKLVCRVDVCYEETDIDSNPAPNPFMDSTLRDDAAPKSAGKKAFSKFAAGLKKKQQSNGPSLAERVQAQVAAEAAAKARPRADIRATGFENGVAIVTGASAGIGAALCEALAVRLGMRVVGVARRGERLESLSQRIADRGGRFDAVVADVTADGAARLACDAAFKHVGSSSPMVLVNNAGLAMANASVLARAASGHDDADDGTRAQAECEATFRCNVLAPVALTREFVARLELSNAPSGSIVNLSSLSAHRHPGATSLGVYAASKAALRTLSEATRQELREARLPYRVSCISPGLVTSDFYEAMHPNNRRAAALVHASQSLAVDDVVDAALFVITAPDNVEVADVLLRTRDSLA